MPRKSVLPIYRPGEVPSLQAATNLAAGRFVAVTDGEQPGSGLTLGGYPAVDSPTIEGVVGNEVKAGQAVRVWAQAVVPVEASAAIAAPALVGTTADGRAKVAASRAVAVGVAWSDAGAAGEFVNVRLFT